jgi:hypothetical protein
MEYEAVSFIESDIKLNDCILKIKKADNINFISLGAIIAYLSFFSKDQMKA